MALANRTLLFRICSGVMNFFWLRCDVTLNRQSSETELEQNRRKRTTPSMIAIPIAVIETPPMANSTLHHPGGETSVRRDLWEEYCFSTSPGAELFYTVPVRRQAPNGIAHQEIRTRMAFPNVIFRRQTASAALNQSCRVSDLYHLTVDDGMQIMAFACVPTIAAFLICFAITMSR